ncbi:TPA: hypothetical protein N0F65_000345 [Lagenidium giganteum]|uniref:FYVE-type domain-containing protein n=1 Tax=Lagenidium giganteum TaxID=4803 RepID=A0AAV2YFC7_9STRA|nr:TPA: hypothetical protein N0F65_000345 [Lagenidium giganteum]
MASSRTASAGSDGSAASTGIGFKLYGLIPAAKKAEENPGRLTGSASFSRYSATSTSTVTHSATTGAAHPVHSAPHSMPKRTTASNSSGGGSQRTTGRVIRSKNSKESFRFPLDEQHMPSVQVCAAKMAEIKKGCDEMLANAINGGMSWLWNPTLAPMHAKEDWKLHTAKRDYVLYRRREGKGLSNRQVRHTLIRAKVDSTLDDLAYGLVCDNTDDQRVFLAHAYREMFLDGGVLQVTDSPTVDDPFLFTGIKWVAFQSPVDSVFSIRDVLFLEYSKTMTDPQGNRVLARVFKSLNIHELGGQDHDFDFLRQEMFWIQLFRTVPDAPNQVDLTIRAMMKYPGKTPNWLANRFISAVHPVVASLSTCADARYIIEHNLISDRRWVDNKERPACSVCFKGFHLLRNRHHCRMCTEIICSSCTVVLSVPTSMLPVGRQRLVKNEAQITCNEKFCLRCIDKVRRERGHALSATVGLGHRMDSSTSPLGSNGSPMSQVYDSEDEGEFAQYYDRRSESQLVRMHSGSLAGSARRLQITYTCIDEERPVRGDWDLSGSKTDSSRYVEMPQLDSRRTGSTSSTVSMASLARSNSDGSIDVDMHMANLQLDQSNDDQLLQSAPPMLHSFQKMEESIAVQQALIRSICMEGEKMMRQKTAPAVSHQSRPAFQAAPQRLALPPTTSINKKLEVEVVRR